MRGIVVPGMQGLSRRFGLIGGWTGRRDPLAFANQSAIGPVTVWMIEIASRSFQSNV